VTERLSVIQAKLQWWMIITYKDPRKLCDMVFRVDSFIEKLIVFTQVKSEIMSVFVQNERAYMLQDFEIQLRVS